VTNTGADLRFDPSEATDSPSMVFGTSKTTADATDEAPEPTSNDAGDDLPPDTSRGVAAIFSMLLTQGGQVSHFAGYPSAVGEPDTASHLNEDLNLSASSGLGTAYPSDDVLTIDSPAISIEGVTIALIGGPVQKPTTTSGTMILIAGETLTALKDGEDVPIAGTKLISGQVTAISGATITVESGGLAFESSTAIFRGSDGSTTKADAIVTIGGTVYSASFMADRSDAVVLAGQTLSDSGPVVTLHGHVITKDSHGVFVVDTIASTTSSVAKDHVESVVTISGSAYTAMPVPGHSGAIVLQGQTISIGGSAVVISDRLVTKGSNGISVLHPSSSASIDISRSASTTDSAGGSTLLQSHASPSEESSASMLGNKVESMSLIMVLLLLVSISV